MLAAQSIAPSLLCQAAAEATQQKKPKKHCLAGNLLLRANGTHLQQLPEGLLQAISKCWYSHICSSISYGRNIRWLEAFSRGMLHGRHCGGWRKCQNCIQMVCSMLTRA